MTGGRFIHHRLICFSSDSNSARFWLSLGFGKVSCETLRK